MCPRIFYSKFTTKPLLSKKDPMHPTPKKIFSGLTFLRALVKQIPNQLKSFFRKHTDEEAHTTSSILFRRLHITSISRTGNL